MGAARRSARVPSTETGGSLYSPLPPGEGRVHLTRPYKHGAEPVEVEQNEARQDEVCHVAFEKARQLSAVVKHGAAGAISLSRSCRSIYCESLG